ncbi:uncharacterized protein LOC116342391 [Contarinia nasturtii]|uniref:uncharacterized protein LOC116342391 n=1 Tax=Contarinia nasturtii TaxID=265458 RepID=UPI0012D3E8BB|nr:uncharacterized protein LOC116342391 [Contarinia nasturtii]
MAIKVVPTRRSKRNKRQGSPDASTAPTEDLPLSRQIRRKSTSDVSFFTAEEEVHKVDVSTSTDGLKLGKTEQGVKCFAGACFFIADNNIQNIQITEGDNGSRWADRPFILGMTCTLVLPFMIVWCVLICKLFPTPK